MAILERVFYEIGKKKKEKTELTIEEKTIWSNVLYTMTSAVMGNLMDAYERGYGGLPFEVEEKKGLQSRDDFQ